MKTKGVILAVILGVGLMFWMGCGNRIQKKIIGIWQIEDITVSGDTSMFDTQQFLRAIEGQKQLRFEMREDSSVSIYTGSAEIDGIWFYKRKGKQVYVTLEGNMEPTLLGKYVDGKLVNSDTNALGAIINTVFIKLEIKEEGENGADSLAVPQ